jgi:hypothetical protein
MNIEMFKLLLCPSAGVAPAGVQRPSWRMFSPLSIRRELVDEEKAVEDVRHRMVQLLPLRWGKRLLRRIRQVRICPCLANAQLETSFLVKRTVKVSARPMTRGDSPVHSVYELDTANHLDWVLGRDQKLWPARDRVAVLPWIGRHAHVGGHHLVVCKNLSHLKRRGPEPRILEPFGGINQQTNASGSQTGMKD